MKTPARGRLVAIILGLACLSSLLASDPTPREETKSVPEFSPVAYCKSLGFGKDEEYIRRLGAEGQVRYLKMIAQTQTWSGGHAAWELSKIMSEKELLAYTRTFPSHTYVWLILMGRLLERDKETYMPHLLQAVKKESVHVRCTYYEMCQRSGWPDLAAYAARDASSTHLFPRFNGFVRETCGGVAQSYLDSLRATKPASGVAK